MEIRRPEYFFYGSANQRIIIEVAHAQQLDIDAKSIFTSSLQNDMDIYLTPRIAFVQWNIDKANHHIGTRTMSKETVLVIPNHMKCSPQFKM